MSRPTDRLAFAESGKTSRRHKRHSRFVFYEVGQFRKADFSVMDLINNGNFTTATGKVCSKGNVLPSPYSETSEIRFPCAATLNRGHLT
ncbi:hypothetical protein SUGI_0093590 [Cryptomeria japonica]|nr:hypothetical protein SUGI_0093590 [Cryptomeria japonica]